MLVLNISPSCHLSLFPSPFCLVCLSVLSLTLFLLPALSCLLCLSGEKRKLPEALTLEDAKRIRVMGDMPMELVNEVMMTITDPAAMLGPEVSRISLLYSTHNTHNSCWLSEIHSA